jgi:lipoprotein-anchoring transpeptidase ErfK/SrfK
MVPQTLEIGIGFPKSRLASVAVVPQRRRNALPPVTPLLLASATGVQNGAIPFMKATVNLMSQSSDAPRRGFFFNRRSLLLATLPLLLAACGRQNGFEVLSGGGYGEVEDGGYTIPAVDTTVNPDLMREEVDWRGKEKPGSIVVNVPERKLYLIQDGGRALKYSVGVGRSEALNFRGSAVIGRKEKWPHWTPTATMMAAMPRYRAYAGGMKGGMGNPLGARALYLYRDGHDTYFRLHGTNEPDSIGHAVSSGCIRLLNQDIIDLYNRVPVGTHVTVVQG